VPSIDPHARWLSIGELSARSGVSVSALRFYERQGLIASERTSGNQRRYPRTTLRRVAFVRVSQRVGLSLSDIRAALASLPADRAPSPADWERISQGWRSQLDARIAELQRLREGLSSCIGCGCLSLEVCGLANADDALGSEGPGSRLWGTDAAAS